MSKICPMEIENGMIDNTFADYLKDTKWTKSKLKRNQSSVFKPFVFKGAKFSSDVGSRLIIDADFYRRPSATFKISTWSDSDYLILSNIKVSKIRLSRFKFGFERVRNILSSQAQRSRKI